MCVKACAAVMCGSSTSNSFKKSMSKKNIIFIVSSRVVTSNSIVDWPDLNKPGTISTYLRVIHKIDYDKLRVQMDSAEGPWIEAENLPEKVGFYELCI